MNKALMISGELVAAKIYFIQGKKVMMDRELAEMDGVKTQGRNELVKRKTRRFLEDLMFQLTEYGRETWKSQVATSNKEWMGLRKLPNVFTEQGVAMLSSVLNSRTAIDGNIQIIHVFTKKRQLRGDHQAAKRIS